LRERQYWVTLRVGEFGLRDAVMMRKPQGEQFWTVLEFIKENTPRANELEKTFGSAVYNILRKLVNSGMVEKTRKGYVLSTHFSEFLRRFAKEWEEFVKEG